MWIDAHCHLYQLNPALKKETLSLSSDDFIFINSSINYSTSLFCLDLSKRYPFIYSALGFHPFSAEEFSFSTLEDYRKLIEENKKVIALGEIGLDCKAPTPLEKQQEILRYFLELALQLDLVVVVHNRSASLKILEILGSAFSSYERIIFHCFSEDVSFLKMVLDRGGFISFSPNIFRKKQSLLEALRYCPLQNLLLETDSPYMKIQDRLCSPLDIKMVYSFVAGMKNIPEEQLQENILYNVRRLFHKMF